MVITSITASDTIQNLRQPLGSRVFAGFYYPRGPSTCPICLTLTVTFILTLCLTFIFCVIDYMFEYISSTWTDVYLLMVIVECEYHAYRLSVSYREGKEIVRVVCVWGGGKLERIVALHARFDYAMTLHS